MRNSNGHNHNGIDTLRPYSLEAEEAVIGSLLIDPDAILNVGQFLKPDDFYIEKNSWVYQAIKDLHDNGIPADLVTISDLLAKSGKLSEIGGDVYLTQLITATPTSINAEWYGRIVEKTAIRRRLIDASAAIAKIAYNDNGDEPEEILGQAEKLLLDVLNNRVETGVHSASEVMNRVAARLERVCQQKGITGIPTGLLDLDRLLSGLQRSDLIVIAGRPGMGKSSLAMQIGVNAAKKHNKRVLVFSLEMSDEQLMQRIAAAESGIDTSRLRNGNIQPNEWAGLLQAQDTINRLPLHISDAASLTPGLMRSQAIRHQVRFGLDLIIIDYLQLMNSDTRGQNRNQEISDISRACKVLARDLNIPVILLSQLSRNTEHRRDKRPMLSDLRDSGAIEADADIVMFLYRDEVYNPDTEIGSVAEIIIAKHRAGPTGVFSVYFKKSVTKFVDLVVNTTPLYQVD